MVEFVTLFLSLALGPVEVELAVGGETAEVVLQLDGSEMGRLTDPPWRLDVDLGDTLRPHRLTAVALDAGGRELARSTQFLNVYRAPVEVDYVLHRNRKGWLTMLELSWPERGGARPGRFAVSVDGKSVDAEDASEIWVPPLDPRELHILEIVVAYPDGSVARDWLGFGGTHLEGDSARLTPVPMSLAESTVEVAAADVVARSSYGGEPVRAVAIERGESEAIIVRDALTARAFENLVPRREVSGSLSGARDAGAARLIHALPLLAEEWVRILDPGGRIPATGHLDPHRTKMRLTSDSPGDFGLFWHIRARDEGAHLGASWISDALAIGATRLANGRRRGAVVLALSAESSDVTSVLSPDAASAYLETVGVPLQIWYLGKRSNAPKEWGEPIELRSIAGLENALEVLRATLGRQRIVWLEGLHLPGEIDLSMRPSSASR